MLQKGLQLCKSWEHHESLFRASGIGYFLEIEFSIDKKQCSRLQKEYERMQVYLRSVRLTCKDKNRQEEVAIIAQGYVLENIQKQCHAQ
ncbi:MAG: hypothetical protein U9N52_11810 [Campylobacterota bacterium]|nr:hypothetical protein [Campylobacterota bacterium]